MFSRIDPHVELAPAELFTPSPDLPVMICLIMSSGPHDCKLDRHITRNCTLRYSVIRRVCHLGNGSLDSFFSKTVRNVRRELPDEVTASLLPALRLVAPRFRDLPAFSASAPVEPVMRHDGIVFSRKTISVKPPFSIRTVCLPDIGTLPLEIRFRIQINLLGDSAGKAKLRSVPRRGIRLPDKAPAVGKECEIFRVSLSETLVIAAVPQSVCERNGLLLHAQTNIIHAISPHTIVQVVFFIPDAIRRNVSAGNIIRTFHNIDLLRQRHKPFSDGNRPDLSGKEETDPGKPFKEIIDSGKRAPPVTMAPWILIRRLLRVVPAENIDGISFPDDEISLIRKLFHIQPRCLCRGIVS